MSDIVSIELLLDAVTESAVRREWDALAAARVSSMAAQTSPSNRPHITLLVRAQLVPFDTAELVDSLPIPLTLGAPMLFGVGDRRVLVRSVVPTHRLMALYDAVHEAAADGDDVAHTAAGEWMPHVSLARRIKLADVPTALAAVEGRIQGRGMSLRRWDAVSRTVTELG